MTAVGERETRTQQRVVRFFRDALGYDYLGHWQDRSDNRNVEEILLGEWLRRQGHGEGIVTRALHELRRAAAISGSRGLYDVNREVYDQLRYGVKVKPEVGEQTITVWLIDWKIPGNNHLVHEMVHLIERTHNDRFRCLMDDLMPQWRTHRDELNQAPLAHEDWTY